jgi:hypothetical protein
MLKIISGPKTNIMAGGYRTLQFCTGAMRNAYRLSVENIKSRDNCEDLSIDGCLN